VDLAESSWALPRARTEMKNAIGLVLSNSASHMGEDRQIALYEVILSFTGE